MATELPLGSAGWHGALYSNNTTEHPLLWLLGGLLVTLFFPRQESDADLKPTQLKEINSVLQLI